jgi:hypothetical protein
MERFDSQSPAEDAAITNPATGKMVSRPDVPGVRQPLASLETTGGMLELHVVPLNESAQKGKPDILEAIDELLGES